MRGASRRHRMARHAAAAWRASQVWIVTLTGSPGTVYAGEKYKLRVEFPSVRAAVAANDHPFALFSLPPPLR